MRGKSGNKTDRIMPLTKGKSITSYGVGKPMKWKQNQWLIFWDSLV
jgi:hypothetical protein